MGPRLLLTGPPCGGWARAGCVPLWTGGAHPRGSVPAETYFQGTCWGFPLGHGSQTLLPLTSDQHPHWAVLGEGRGDGSESGVGWSWSGPVTRGSPSLLGSPPLSGVNLFSGGEVGLRQKSQRAPGHPRVPPPPQPPAPSPLERPPRVVWGPRVWGRSQARPL